MNESPNINASDLKVAVCGLWHLGSVTVACCAEAGFKTVGFDEDLSHLRNLKQGSAPLYEPGLDNLIKSCLEQGTLSFTSEPSQISSADIVWITYDTPVDENDNADDQVVIDKIIEISNFAKSGAAILISSQLPLGTARKIEHLINRLDLTICVSPENLRLGEAISAFKTQDFVVVGRDSANADHKVEILVSTFCENIFWVSIPSAELVKHSINGFLALSIAFTNELAAISEQYGANFFEVEKALRSEPRIGKKAYVRPGEAFAGGTLARDLRYLSTLSEKKGLRTSLIDNVIKSNEHHKTWHSRKVKQIAIDYLSGKKKISVAVIGLTYKENTSTTRRSAALEMIEDLVTSGFTVKAFDPSISFDFDYVNTGFTMVEDIFDCIQTADIICLMRNVEGLAATSTSEIELAIHSNEKGSATPKFFIDQLGIRQDLATSSKIKYITFGS